MCSIIENQDLYFSAETNYKQFLALAAYSRHYDILDDLLAMDYFSRQLRKSSTCKLPIVRKWLFNCWNTERILRLNSNVLEQDNNFFILQWSFPQAYYAAFSSTMAFFKTVGYTEESHKSVIKKFSSLSVENKYPRAISFCCSGIKSNIQYYNLDCTGIPRSTDLNIFDFASIQNKVCQFLKTTRKIQLDEKRSENGVKKLFKTKNEQIKLNLNDADWSRVSEMVGYTGLLDLLYRKRIKANYQDIDTFNFEGIRALQINKCLVNVINNIALTHESMIYKAIGLDDYLDIYSSFTRGKPLDFLDNRLGLINNRI